MRVRIKNAQWKRCVAKKLHERFPRLGINVKTLDNWQSHEHLSVLKHYTFSYRKREYISYSRLSRQIVADRKLHDQFKSYYGLYRVRVWGKAYEYVYEHCKLGKPQSPRTMRGMLWKVYDRGWVRNTNIVGILSPKLRERMALYVERGEQLE